MRRKCIYCGYVGKWEWVAKILPEGRVKWWDVYKCPYCEKLIPEKVSKER